MKGKVYLVGAGPGDYGLMTLKGLEALRTADVVVYDRLVNERFLKETQADCEKIYVGKESANHTMVQEEINELLGQKAQEGKVVVRLKGGDPYVFGRGGEEGEHLYEQRIPFEVVPGITSAIGGLCYGGIPITHRGLSTSFHVITGHLKDDDRELDWEALSRLGGTLVFLMGMANLQEIAEKLIAYGRDGKTPAAVIQWATTSRQKVVTGTLREIYEQARQKKMTSPSLIVVGDVVKLREKLNFFDKRPLKGKNIVVTRAREQSSSLVEQMEALGGCAIEIPAISIEPIEPNPPLSEAIQQIHRYTYILFTSVNGVRIFFASLFASGADARALSGIRIVTVGRSTADALRQYGICADLIPKKYSGDDLVELMKDQATAKDCILIPRAEQGSPQLVQALERLCPVTEIPVYRTIQDKSGKDQLIQRLRDQDIDYITFTSSSTVQNLMDMIGEEKKLLERVKLISIGPITSKTLEEGGLPVYKQAEQATIEGLIACIEKDVQEE